MLFSKKIICAGFILFAFCSTANAQDTTDIMSQLESETESTTDYTAATFKTTRLINGHTV